MEKLTLSASEAAQVIGISRPRMYQLMKVKGFPTVQVGRRLLVSRKGLERWVEEQSKIGWNPQDL